jgi:aspartyl/asparaginyl-tRNA synthetase
MDFEMAFADEFVIMDVLARAVQYVVKKVLEERKDELAELEIKDLVIPQVKYMTFEEVKKFWQNIMLVQNHMI